MIFFGRNVVLEGLKSPYNIRSVFIQDNINKDDKVSTILQLAKKSNIKVQNLNLKELNRFFKSSEHQGVGIDIDFTVSKIKVSEDDYQNNNAYFYISDATYEHNIGAIIRSAECAGIQGIVIPNDVKITPTVARASAGAIFHIPIYRESIYNTIKKFKDLNFNIFGIERDGKRYFDIDLVSPALFIIGGEDKSLSDSIRKECSEILEIPQFGTVNSLNMSVASSIILFERVRQKLNS